MLEAKRRAFILLLLAFLLAAVAGYLVFEKVKQLNAELGGMVEIYVAKGNIPVRSLLHSSQLTTMEIPQKFLTDSHITAETDLVNKVSVVPLDQGDIVTKSMLKDYANLQKENHRLVALYRTDKVQFDQEVAPLDRVDIVVSHDVDGKKKTETFMKDVSVAYAQGTGESFAGIAVEVSSTDATKLIHMQNYAEYIRVLKANVGQDTSTPTEETPPVETKDNKESKVQQDPTSETKDQSTEQQEPTSNTTNQSTENNS